MIARSLFVALMPTILTALAACGGGGSGSTTDPNPTIPQLPPTASITSFSISPDTVDLRDAVTFEWQTVPGSPDFTLALTGHGDVTGRSPLTIDDIRFGGTYTLRMTRENGTGDAREASLTIRPESVPQGFVGVLNDNLLVWHGWKLDHRQPAGAQDGIMCACSTSTGLSRTCSIGSCSSTGWPNTEHYTYASILRRGERSRRARLQRLRAQ